MGIPRLRWMDDVGSNCLACSLELLDTEVEGLVEMSGKTL